MRASRDSMLMAMAWVASRRGTCNRLSVGAVIAHDSRVVSTGYNGNPSGMDHCSHTKEDLKCTTAVHAEANAIAFAARWGGKGTQDATLYVTHAPCLECAKLIINSGITAVIYDRPYRLTEGLEMLHSAGVQVTRFDS